MGNTFKTAFLLTALTLLLMGIGRAFGGQNGMLLALGVAAVTNFVAYFFSDKIALATYRAQPVTREQLPRVYEVVVFFSSRRRHTMYIGDWSSDVCSSDLLSIVLRSSPVATVFPFELSRTEVSRSRFQTSPGRDGYCRSVSICFIRQIRVLFMCATQQ